MFDYLGISLLLTLVVVFSWLTRRAWRIRRSGARWLAAGTASLLTLTAVGLLGAGLYGFWKLNRRHYNPIPQISVEITPERVARGAWFEPYCSGCHAPENGAPMTGRDFLAGDDAPPIGEMWAPNLTPVHLSDWSDGEIVRAVREGVHRSGRSLMIMPSRVLRNLSDRDVQAIVAWLRSLQPEGEDTPPNRLNVLGAIMLLPAPIMEAQPPITEPVAHPPAGPNAAYGAYLSSFTCDLCHGEDLLGDPEWPAPPLISIPVAWSESEFLEFMRTGIRPDGTEVDGEVMPWETLSRLFHDDEDLRAIYAHLQASSNLEH